MSLRRCSFVIAVFTTFLIAGCSDEMAIRRKIQKIGPQQLREQILGACRESFTARSPQRIPESAWPACAHVFNPLGLWAEPDGAYLLLDSDADGERGLFVPRIFSEKDPVCSKTLTHKKLADGVYWYDKTRL